MWLAKFAYELTMWCQKHNRTNLITTRVPNNFLQVIYSLKTQYSYDVTENYLNYYLFKFFSRSWYQLIINNNFHCMHFYCLTISTWLGQCFDKQWFFYAEEKRDCTKAVKFRCQKWREELAFTADPLNWLYFEWCSILEIYFFVLDLHCFDWHIILLDLKIAWLRHSNDKYFW